MCVGMGMCVLAWACVYCHGHVCAQTPQGRTDPQEHKAWHTLRHVHACTGVGTCARARMHTGMIDASTTLRPRRPWTLP